MSTNDHIVVYKIFHDRTGSVSHRQGAAKENVKDFASGTGLSPTKIIITLHFILFSNDIHFSFF